MSDRDYKITEADKKILNQTQENLEKNQNEKLDKMLDSERLSLLRDMIDEEYDLGFYKGVELKEEYQPENHNLSFYFYNNSINFFLNQENAEGKLYQIAILQDLKEIKRTAEEYLFLFDKIILNDETLTARELHVDNYKFKAINF